MRTLANSTNPHYLYGIKQQNSAMGSSVIPPARIEKYDDVLEFLFAGRAVFTLLDTRNQQRATFKVTQAYKNNQPQSMWFVKVKVNDYDQYVGYINKDGVYYHGKPPAAKLPVDDIRVKYFRAFMLRMNERAMPEFIHFWHEGICAKCGRPLTVPESISSGFGPVCKRRMVDVTVPMRKGGNHGS